MDAPPAAGTRSQKQGKPLKKPGAYDTGAYYAEKDEGFGDVGVGQEPDAGQLDNPQDPEFTVSKDEMREATQRADEGLAEADVPAEEDIADLKGGATEEGAPGGVPDVVRTSRDETEAQEAQPYP